MRGGKRGNIELFRRKSSVLCRRRASGSPLDGFEPDFKGKKKATVGGGTQKCRRRGAAERRMRNKTRFNRLREGRREAPEVGAPRMRGAAT